MIIPNVIDMEKISLEKHVKINDTTAWSVIKQFGNAHHFTPSVDVAYLISENAYGVNAERVCHLTNGFIVKEKIVDYNEAKNMVVSIYEGIK